MITATLLHDILEVKIVSGSHREFDHDLRQLCALIAPSDRAFVDFKSVWVVKDWSKYAHLPFVQAAVKASRLQPDLFQEAA